MSSDRRSGRRPWSAILGGDFETWQSAAKITAAFLLAPTPRFFVTTFSGPDEAIDALAARLTTVAAELGTLASGRVLAEPILLDRDSPAADVSAMDGYAVRMNDLASDEPVPVVGEVQPGESPPAMPAHGVLRIFTGAVLPPGAEAVVKREDAQEQPTAVRWLPAVRALTAGANIRRQGENGRAGTEALAAGTQLHAASIATAISFGAARALLHHPVRCSVIVTGNELLGVSDSPQPWQLRDSNGPTVAAMLSEHPWLRLEQQARCGDDRQHLHTQLAEALQHSDAVILTGGVSKGDYDHVPGVITDVGGEIIFHRLPIRPGQPILGAVTAGGQLILGLPGNPVSAACGMLRFGLPLLRKLSGNQQWQSRPLSVLVQNPGEKTLPLHWMRLARLTRPSGVTGAIAAELVASQGSGDLVALGASDGFIEQPPGAAGAGPWPFYRWRHD